MFLDLNICFQSSVPATPPQNVQATAISSTEIMVTWDEIPGLDQNGIITDYEIQIEPLDFTTDLVANRLNTTNLSMLVTDLEENIRYSIEVRAYTSVGPGPYSVAVTVRTFEDGNVLFIPYILSPYNETYLIFIPSASYTSTKCPSHSHLLH